MDMITFSMYTVIASIGRRNNEKIISFFPTQMTGGPSRRTRISIKRVIKAASISNVKGLLQEVSATAKELTKVA